MEAPPLSRTPYPTDVLDDERAFVAPSLTQIDEDAPPRRHALRKIITGLRFLVCGGLPWRLMPHDLPPWWVVYQ